MMIPYALTDFTLAIAKATAKNMHAQANLSKLLAINLCRFDCENEYVCPVTLSFIICFSFIVRTNVCRSKKSFTSPFRYPN